MFLSVSKVKKEHIEAAKYVLESYRKPDQIQEGFGKLGHFQKQHALKILKVVLEYQLPNGERDMENGQIMDYQEPLLGAFERAIKGHEGQQAVYTKVT